MKTRTILLLPVILVFPLACVSTIPPIQPGGKRTPTVTPVLVSPTPIGWMTPATETPTITPSPSPTITPTPTHTLPPAPAEGAWIGGCRIFPADNVWNARVDTLPVNQQSEAWINSIGRTTGLHMDFGSGSWDGGPIGIPYNLADASTPRFTLSFYYPDESDPGPYPIPVDARREWGSDHHILVVDTSECRLYEVYDASFDGSNWSGGSGAVWDLASNDLRPSGWTSADAAGLPILPGLVRYDEVAAGEIRHAIRFTASRTNGYIWPARHLTSDDFNPDIPPMGARFRLKASFDISGYPPKMQVILRAMKEYGIILADNGSDWYISGAPDERWDNDMLHLLDDITGDDFEAIDADMLMGDPDSAQVSESSP